MPKDIVQLLRDCQNDPMWADHAEVPKAICEAAANEIEKLRAALVIFGKVSMSEVRPVRREYHIGWQDVDGEYGVAKSQIKAAMKIAREI